MTYKLKALPVSRVGAWIGVSIWLEMRKRLKCRNEAFPPKAIKEDAFIQRGYCLDAPCEFPAGACESIMIWEFDGLGYEEKYKAWQSVTYREQEEWKPSDLVPELKEWTNVMKKRDREWRDYPVGTKAHAFHGGAWLRTERGWQWNGHTCSPGSTFPTPGADACGYCVELPHNVRSNAPSQATEP